VCTTPSSLHSLSKRLISGYLMYITPSISVFEFLFLDNSTPSFIIHSPFPVWLGARSETSREATVRSYLVGNAGSRPISEAKQPWACPVLGWGTTGEAHVLYSFLNYFLALKALRSAQHTRAHTLGHRKTLGQNRVILPPPALDVFFFLGHHHLDASHISMLG
jgi:hypothetical protein